MKFGNFETNPGLSRDNKWLSLVHDVTGNDVPAKLALDEGELLPYAKPDTYIAVQPEAGALKTDAVGPEEPTFRAEIRLMTGQLKLHTCVRTACCEPTVTTSGTSERSRARPEFSLHTRALLDTHDDPSNAVPPFRTEYCSCAPPL